MYIRELQHLVPNLKIYVKNMRASETIKRKLIKAGGKTQIKQLQGNVTDFYFVKDYTFWSKGLNSLLGNGYGFNMFDILEKESYRLPNRLFPKRKCKKL
jgi:hypothetical protein